jgi:leader peptidase (prepilin peptidase)/N-methyltransferase
VTDNLQHVIFIIFLSALGACVGSFLNVVVWRLPRGESLVFPGSRCPRCGHALAWFDNIPVLGWILLGGKCRYCREPISPRYPIIEFLTGALFLGYYLVFFVAQRGPCPPDAVFARPLSIQQDWPIYLLYMVTIAALLAISLIDAELFIIPIEIPWLLAALGIIVHTIIDRPSLPGALTTTGPPSALAAGATVGLIISMILLKRGIIPISFAENLPLLEHEREKLAAEIEQAKSEQRPPPEAPPEMSRGQLRAEMRKEMLFLLPPLILGGLWMLLCWKVEPIGRAWGSFTTLNWASGLLGALLGALAGGFVVWITRILGTLVFGREAMGMGDVHLMFGVGAVVGAGAVTVAFFVAPFFGLVIAIYMIFAGRRRELPYGPYLSLGCAFVMIFYCPIAVSMRPGLQGLMMMIQSSLFGG